MEGHDHGDCPVELRACPDHEAESSRSIAEAMSREPDPALTQKLQERPRCPCGCDDDDMSRFVGWCLHCTHSYAKYNSEIEDRHFAYVCPGAPEQLKKSARERLVKH